MRLSIGYGNVAAVQLDEVLDDREAQPCAARVSGA
jgi:hypothetical protein